MTPKQIATLADQFDQLSALFLAISGTFRPAESGGGKAGGDGKAGKAVRGKPAAANGDDEITEDTLREKLTAIAEKHGKDRVAEVLAEVGAGRLSEVEEESYADLAEACDKVLAAKTKPAAKKPAGKTKAPPAPTFDEVKEKFTELVEADKKAAKKILTDAGLTRLSDVDADDEGAMTDLMTAITEALGDDGGLV